MTTNIAYLGESMALLNAVLWAFSIILFKISGHSISPTSLNIFKNTIGSFFLLLTLLIMGAPFYLPGSNSDYFLLILSGIIGIGIADTLLFKSLNLLGASRSAIVDCLYAPFIMFFSYLFLFEEMTWMKILGAFLIVVSIPMIYSDRKKDPIDPGVFAKGLLWGALSMALMGLSIVYIKPQLESYPVVWVTTVRMTAGTVFLFAFVAMRKDRARILSIFKPQKLWKVALPPSFLGAYPCILLWVGSFKYAQASIAGIITQLSVFFTVILAHFFLGEPLTVKKRWAVVLAFGGSAIATFTQK